MMMMMLLLQQKRNKRRVAVPVNVNVNVNVTRIGMATIMRIVVFLLVALFSWGRLMSQWNAMIQSSSISAYDVEIEHVETTAHDHAAHDHAAHDHAYTAYTVSQRQSDPVATVTRTTVTKSQSQYTPLNCFNQTNDKNNNNNNRTRICDAVLKLLQQEREQKQEQSNPNPNPNPPKSFLSTTPPPPLPCDLSEGPVPVILVNTGRSGSTSTWETLGQLTGQKTKAWEAMGNSERAVTEFLQTNTDGFQWLPRILCDLQHKHPTAAFVGFKWKSTVVSSELMYTSMGSLTALQFIKFYTPMMALQQRQRQQQINSNTNSSVSSSFQSSTMTDRSTPIVKVLRSRRNPLDVHLSGYKRRLAPQKLPTHCETIPSATENNHHHNHSRRHQHYHPPKPKPNNKKVLERQRQCLDAHLAAGTNITISNVTELIQMILKQLEREDNMDHLLQIMKIPYAYASYEELYYTDPNTRTTNTTTKQTTTFPSSSSYPATATSTKETNDTTPPVVHRADAWIRFLNHMGLHHTTGTTTTTSTTTTVGDTEASSSSSSSSTKRNDALTMQHVQAAMPFTPTHNRHHNMTIANHEEVYAALQEAGLEYLWH